MILIMRKRNIKINVFLNEYEKKMLEEKSNKARLSQSDFIRNLIRDYTDDKPLEFDIVIVVNSIFNIASDLSKLKNKLHYLGYFHEEEHLQNKIDNLNNLIKSK